MSRRDSDSGWYSCPDMYNDCFVNHEVAYPKVSWDNLEYYQEGVNDILIQLQS